MISCGPPLGAFQQMLVDSAVRAAYQDAGHSVLQWSILSALDRPDEDHPVIEEWMQYCHFMRVNGREVERAMVRRGEEMKRLVRDAIKRGPKETEPEEAT